MNRQLAHALQRQLRIPLEHIVREEYEMIILKGLFESKVATSIIFKGGTALRLAYGSPRFSEDLDFSVTTSFQPGTCDRVLRSITAQHETLTLKDLRRKRSTYFAIFHINEDFLRQAFSIKFEASTRPDRWQKGKDFQLMSLNSQVTSLSVLAQVATLTKIKAEKQSIKSKRIRDLFDLWFIGQKLGKHTPMHFEGWSAKLVRRELHRLLPEHKRKILLPWLPER